MLVLKLNSERGTVSCLIKWVMKYWLSKNLAFVKYNECLKPRIAYFAPWNNTALLRTIPWGREGKMRKSKQLRASGDAFRAKRGWPSVTKYHFARFALWHVLFLPQFWQLFTLMRTTEGLVTESTGVYDYNGKGLCREYYWFRSVILISPEVMPLKVVMIWNNLVYYISESLATRQHVSQE